MRAYFHLNQKEHFPKHFLSAGLVKPCPEHPARCDALLNGLEQCGIVADVSIDLGSTTIEKVHDREYLKFLKTISSQWKKLATSSDEVIPNVHPRTRIPKVGYPSAPVGLAGYYMADTACPVTDSTWEAAYWSAQTALNAAEAVLKGQASAYALCRPPGHHACADQAGGFCYLNNSAIAAEHCVMAGKKVAIMDVDLHHGNGTQDIFYHRPDVFTASLHANPQWYYPFFSGYAEEVGEGEGEGTNFNLPLDLGSGNVAFQAGVEKIIDRLNAFNPDIILVALGLDAFEGDPFGGLKVTTVGFHKIAQLIRSAGYPTIIVQEGGYLCPQLGENLAAFLEAFRS